MDMGVEEYQNDMKGIHPELYEEEYRRTMRSIILALHYMDERGLAWQVYKKLRNHIREKEEFEAKTLKQYQAHTDDTYLPRWIGYLRRIPKQGLNNLTKKPRSSLVSRDEWTGTPTLPRRLRSVCMTGFFDSVKLPFFYYHMEMRTSRNFKRYVDSLPKIQEITKQIVERLEELYDKMDTVTVLSERELRYWKEAIRYTILCIRKKSGWVGLKLIQESGYEVLESTPLAPLIEETKEEPK